MKRLSVINQEIIIGTAEIVVELAQADVASLTIELTLLLCAMSSALTLRSPAREQVELTLESPDVWGRAKKLAANHVRFDLSRNQAEYLQAVLLRAYRDQMAEVNHVHLEGTNGNETMDLTLLFQVYKPPMSAEAAAKAMGD